MNREQGTKLSLFTDRAVIPTSGRVQPIALFQAHFNDLTIHERLKKYGARASCYEFVSEPKEADFFILPATWLSYRGRERMGRAFAARAKRNGKALIVWGSGDPQSIVPFDNAVQIEEGLHRGLKSRAKLLIEKPAFVADLCNELTGKWSPAPYTERPQLSFCGWANPSVRQQVVYPFFNGIAKVRYGLGISRVVPILHGNPVRFRQKVLRSVLTENSVSANFILRRRYKDGLSNQSAFGQTSSRREFVNNLYSSPYALCVRGWGNYSKRFYEALCLGRIPVLVDTDNVLPFEKSVPWDKYIVRVDWRDFGSLSRKLVAFHNSHTKRSLAELQCECREFWKKSLCADGFYRSLSTYGPLFELERNQ